MDLFEGYPVARCLVVGSAANLGTPHARGSAVVDVVSAEVVFEPVVI